MKKGVKNSNKAQAGVEYMIIISFVTFAIMAILLLAYFYSGLIHDRIKINQVESFGIQLVNQAESVFFSGEPSIATIRLYLPDGVQSINVNSDSLVIISSTSTGENVRSFTSRVPLQGNISASEGTKTITLRAEEDYVSMNN